MVSLDNALSKRMIILDRVLSSAMDPTAGEVSLFSTYPPSLLEGFRSSLHRAGDFHRTLRSINGEEESEDLQRAVLW